MIINHVYVHLNPRMNLLSLSIYIYEGIVMCFRDDYMRVGMPNLIQSISRSIYRSVVVLEDPSLSGVVASLLLLPTLSPILLYDIYPTPHGDHRSPPPAPHEAHFVTLLTSSSWPCAVPSLVAPSSPCPPPSSVRAPAHSAPDPDVNLWSPSSPLPAPPPPKPPPPR